MRMVDKEMQAH